MVANTRRKYIVSGSQYRLLCFNLGYYLLFAGVLAVGLWGPLVAGVLSENTPEDERLLLAEMLLFLDGRLLPLALVLGVLFGLHSVLVSHRMAGPVYRLTRSFRNLADGDLTDRITLRRKDYLHEEVAQYNEMLASLSSRLREMQERMRAVQRKGGELERAVNDGDVSELSARVRSLNANLDEVLDGWTDLDLGTPVQQVTETTLEELDPIRPERQRTSREALLEARGQIESGTSE